MAKLKIELIIGEGQVLTFDETQVLDWSTKTFCTSDASLPVFDMFPNSGSVVIKDSNLELFDNAISGVFNNNYNYELNIYVDDEKIAHHLVNEQPKYSYEEKTLTLYLGNELDIANDLIYEGYAYPLEEQTFLTIFRTVITSLFNISSEKLNKLLSKQYSASTSDGNQTFYEYFDSIDVPYPYISSKPYREVLRNLLTIAKCCLYEDENKDLVLVRMDGGFAESVNTTTPSANIYNNVNFVLPSQTSVGFVPSVIQQNNYNVAEIGCNMVEQNTLDGKFATKESDVPEEKLDSKDSKTNVGELDSITYYKIDGGQEITRTGLYPFYYTGSILTSCEEIYGVFVVTSSLLQKNNLIKALTPLKKENIQFALTQGKLIKTTTTGRLYLTGSNESGGYGAYSFSPSSSSSTTETIITPAFSQPKEITYNNLSLTFTNIDDETDLIGFDSDYDFKYYAKKYVGCKYYCFKFNNSQVNRSASREYDYLDDVTCEEITLIPLSASFSFNGEYVEIQFNGKTLTAPSNVSPAHKMTIENGGGLMQYTGDISETSFPVQYALDLLGWYNGGIRTGQLSVIKDVYTNYSDDFETISIYENLSAGSSKIITDNSIKSWGIYQLTYASSSTSAIYNGATISNLSISIINGQITITNNGSSAIRLREITKFSTSNIVGQANHKVFKCGDLIVPCKDYQYTPIMTNSSGQPIIYQVVVAETFGEGGAVFQTLQVREVKSTKASELPYYLVANATGITICIKDNGYATEGTNNEIIQIGWQT